MLFVSPHLCQTSSPVAFLTEGKHLLNKLKSAPNAENCFSKIKMELLLINIAHGMKNKQKIEEIVLTTIETIKISLYET